MTTINVSLGEDMVAFVNREVDSGNYSSASEVVREALRLLECERTLEFEKGALLKREVLLALAEAERGEFSDLTVDEIARRVLQEGA